MMNKLVRVIPWFIFCIILLTVNSAFATGNEYEIWRVDFEGSSQQWRDGYLDEQSKVVDTGNAEHNSALKIPAVSGDVVLHANLYANTNQTTVKDESYVLSFDFCVEGENAGYVMQVFAENSSDEQSYMLFAVNKDGMVGFAKNGNSISPNDGDTVFHKRVYCESGTWHTARAEVYIKENVIRYYIDESFVGEDDGNSGYFKCAKFFSSGEWNSDGTVLNEQCVYFDNFTIKHRECGAVDAVTFDDENNKIQTNSARTIGVPVQSGNMTIETEPDGNRCGVLSTGSGYTTGTSTINVININGLTRNEKYIAGFRFRCTPSAEMLFYFGAGDDKDCGIIKIKDSKLQIGTNWDFNTEKFVCNDDVWHNIYAEFEPNSKLGKWYLDGVFVTEVTYSSADIIETIHILTDVVNDELVSGKVPVCRIDDVYAYSSRGESPNLSIKSSDTDTGEVSISISSKQLGNIFTDNERPNFVIKALNTGATARNYSGMASITDDKGKILWKESLQFNENDANKEATEIAIEPKWDNDVRYGCFYLEVRLRYDSDAKYVIKRIPFSIVYTNGIRNSKMGFSTHYVRLYNTEHPERYYDEVRLNSIAGMGLNREEFQWEKYETQRGEYKLTDTQNALFEAISDNDIKPMIILQHTTWLYGLSDDAENEMMPMPINDYQREKYAEYVRHICEDTKQYSPYYEIGNEWNLSDRNQTYTYNDGTSVKMTVKEHYIPMMKTAYDTIKGVNPNSTVVGLAVGMSDKQEALEFIKECFENGAASYCDAISVHPYTTDFISAEEDEIRNFVNDIRAITNKYKPELSIVFSEWGWSSVPGAVTEEEQAKYSVRGAAMVTDIIDSLIWYEGQNNAEATSNLDEMNFGMLNSSTSEVPLSAKPAYVVMCCYNSLTADKEKQAPTLTDNNIYQCRYNGDKSDVIMLWTKNGRAEVNVPAESYGSAVLYDMYGNRHIIYAETGSFTFEVSEEPIYLELSNELRILSFSLYEQAGNYCVSTEIVNGTDIPQTCLVIVAEYGQNEKMLNVSIEKVEFDDNTKICQRNVSIEKVSEVNDVRAFLWNEDMTPLRECSVISIR